MSVKITGMEMPKSCIECRFRLATYISFCVAKAFPISFEEERAKLNNRPSWCPLQEVKE